MCGRFVQNLNPEVVQQEFDLTSVPELPPRYNVAPTQTAFVITNDQPRTLTPLRWGLIPSWSKDAAIGGRLINARSETVEEKPSFKHALRRRRCIVPVSGFYEWRADPDGKTPLYVYPADRPVFALAGLWEVWQDPATREPVTTFTILTTEANAFMRELHERMPVILDRPDYEAWLHSADPLVLRALMKPYAAGELIKHPVTKAVNKPSYDAPECILPVA